MKCPACGFENVPGEDRCGRCNGQLKEAKQDRSPREMMPPRAGRFKFLRPVAYSIRRSMDKLPERMPLRLSGIFTRGSLPGDAMMAMMLSFVPGLGHLMDGRRRAAALGFVGWFLLLLIVLQFRIGLWGGLLGGFLVSWHVSVILDAGRPQVHLRERSDVFRLMIPVLILCMLAYGCVDRALRQRFFVSACHYDVPPLEIRSGEVLLFRRQRLEQDSIQRDEIWLQPRNVGGARIHIGQELVMDLQRAGDIPYWVVGLPGDLVEVAQDGARINGKLIDLGEILGDPTFLPSDPIFMTVPEGYVFALTHYIVGGRGAVYQGVLWQNLFMVQRNNLRARALAIYLPITKRRMLRVSSERERGKGGGS